MLTDRKHRPQVIKDENYRNYKLATSQGIGVFWTLLWKWRGSVYKLLYIDLAIYFTFFYIIRGIYLFLLSDHYREYFEEVVRYCEVYSQKFPLSFVLGFFVSTVMSRWWTQFTLIPRPHGVGVLVSSLVHGVDETGKEMRRTILRYVCLSITMALRKLSTRARRRFPDEVDLMDAGLLKDDEHAIIKQLQNSFPGTSMYILPIDWAITIVEKARKLDRIHRDVSYKTILDELKRVQNQLETLLKFNLTNISIVYCQVVTIACYSYFIAALFGSQLIFIGSNKSMVEFANFPIFLMLNFIFYMGWLKVGEALMNPFGDDDDDIDTVALIDKNLQISYLIVDKLHEEHPATLNDRYWKEFEGQSPQT